MISDYRDENYASIDDIEYIYGNIDNYYAPMLTSSLFIKVPFYYFRGTILEVIKCVICL